MKFCLARKCYRSIFETCVNIKIHFFLGINDLNKLKKNYKFAKQDTNFTNFHES
jgi:hypothetical protein